MSRLFPIGVLVAVKIKPEMVWTALIALLLVLSVWWFPGGAKGLSDTFGAGAGGKKVFYALVQKLLPEVRRNTDLSRLPEKGATLLILGPARYPDGAEWTKLHAWVRAGGVLIFAARADDPAVNLGPFGLKVTPHSQREDGKEKKAAEKPEPDSGFEVDPDFAGGDFDWGSLGWVEGASDGAWTPVSRNGLPVVLYQDVGEGEIVVLASDDLFTNATLIKKDNGVLAYRVLEMAERGGPIAFNESLNAGGAPKTVGLLFDGELRSVSLQALICTVLFGWWGSRRFGPPLPPPKVARRDITEHAVALGNLHYKVGTGSRAVASYLEFFRRELRLAHLIRAGEDPAGVVARRAQLEPSAVRQTLGMAERAARESQVASRQAAAAVRALASLKERVERPRKASPERLRRSQRKES